MSRSSLNIAALNTQAAWRETWETSSANLSSTRDEAGSLNNTTYIIIKIVAELLLLQTRKWKLNASVSFPLCQRGHSNSLVVESLSKFFFHIFQCMKNKRNITSLVFAYLRCMLLLGSESGPAKKVGEPFSSSLCVQSSKSPFLNSAVVFCRWVCENQWCSLTWKHPVCCT